MGYVIYKSVLAVLIPYYTLDPFFWWIEFEMIGM